MSKKTVVKISDIYPGKNLKINKAISYLNIPKYDRSTLFKEYPLPSYTDLKLPTGIIDVVIDSPHAFERWNLRVGPITTEGIITNIFRMAILTQPNRIRVLEKELAILDDEFVFSFRFENSIFTITTFYGRISLLPMLSNVDVLRKYNLHFNEQINLNVDINTLNRQKLPLTPTSVIEFEDEEKKHHLLFYFRCNEERNVIYHSVRERYLEAASEWNTQIIDLSHPSRFILSDTQLHLLGLLGHNLFIIQYMYKADPDRLKKLHETHSRTALRRFAKKKGWKYIQK
ncbi:hypothetical protein ACOMCU_25180 [Lysinibacillus sp. UGB7]|uniref:hypothetical protein n=1 Tax=Lysinibacillus sp. UGB7 TaxID=3411039 RepID=UPI003B79DB23